MTAATQPTTAAADPATPDDPTEPILTTVPADDVQPEPEKRKKTTAAADRARAAITNWWGFVRHPMSLEEAWRASDVIDARRIPGDSQMAAALWWWSNRTDRVLLFLCVCWAPLWLIGPLLYCVVRPSRRWGLYLVLFILFVIVPRVTGG